MNYQLPLSPQYLWLLIPLSILDLVLKAFALWRAAHKNQTVWFVLLLIVSSLGVLPAVYLLLHRKKKH